jgi:hypothetical protein
VQHGARANSWTLHADEFSASTLAVLRVLKERLGSDVHFCTLEHEQHAVRIHEPRLCDFEQAEAIIRGQIACVSDL